MTVSARISDIRARDINVGESFGPYSYELTPSSCALWNRTFETELRNVTDRVAAGAMSLYYLKCGMDAFGGIPRGAVLTNQLYRFDEEPVVGTPIDARLVILSKEKRKERSWITFKVELTQAGRAVSQSQLTWIWTQE